MWLGWHVQFKWTGNDHKSTDCHILRQTTTHDLQKGVVGVWTAEDKSNLCIMKMIGRLFVGIFQQNNTANKNMYFLFIISYIWSIFQPQKLEVILPSKIIIMEKGNPIIVTTFTLFFVFLVHLFLFCTKNSRYLK